MDPQRSISRDLDPVRRPGRSRTFLLLLASLFLTVSPGHYRTDPNAPSLRRIWRIVRTRTGGLRDGFRRLGDPLCIQRSVPLEPEDRSGKRRRQHVLVDLVHEHLPEKAVRVAEIGCDWGDTSVHLMKYCPQIEDVVAVDLKRPRSIRLHAEPRFRFVQGYSDAAAAQFPAASFHLVFIDADHSEEWVARDIAAWYPKVKPGGIISGHDYGSRNHPGVKRAVDRFFTAHPHPVHLEANKVWWTFKV